MTIKELTEVVKTITLEKLNLNSFYIGNTWDHSTGKADQYPNLWFEMPVLLNYNIQNKQFKTFIFSVDILMMPKMDDPIDEIDKISQCEVLMDKFLHYLKANGDYNIFLNPTALSIKSINADNACGVRADIQVNTKRECL